MNDAGIFANSDLGHALVENVIDLPPPRYLPNTEILSPHYLIGDRIFPLKRYLLKPFIRNENLTMSHRAFNYRLSFARRIIENAFGELASKWLIHQSTLDWKLSTSEFIIMSTICLHNMLLDFKFNEVGNRWNRILIDDIRARNVHVIQDNIIQNLRNREDLCQYFISPQGSVPWQWEKM